MPRRLREGRLREGRWRDARGSVVFFIIPIITGTAPVVGALGIVIFDKDRSQAH